MSRYFHVEGSCNPEEHYMVDLSERLQKIKILVDKRKYFSINRGRQYGKTTLLDALAQYLQKDYIVAALDFQFLTYEDFKNEFIFTAAFTDIFLRSVQGIDSVSEESLDNIKKCHEFESGLSQLFRSLSDFCEKSPKPVVLIIDEVDSATNNQVFLDFLAQLRAYYLHRKKYAAFHSVILAGVYDIKHLKMKLRPEEEHKTNSPWNIAADFDVDMSFNEKDISGMLRQYEQDYNTGMDISRMSVLIREYTGGYPFLVSRICQLIDEKISGSAAFPDRQDAWTISGFQEAVKLLLQEKNALFESLLNKMIAYPELRDILYITLFSGIQIPYSQLVPSIEIAAMFGFIKNENSVVTISNRIFETLLYNYFLSEEMLNSQMAHNGILDKNQFVRDGILNMELVLQKFMLHWNDLYQFSEEKFIEDNGRKFFLLYLKPIINGTGNYYIEAQTRSNRRTDIIVDYLGKQYIIEIKIWRGNEYNLRGETQLADYLEEYHAKTGYLISFNFNKNKETGMKRVQIGDKYIVEAVI